MATLRHGTMSMPDGSLVEPRRNMVKSMAGFLEKPAILFAMFFNLGINILSNITIKLSFLVWGSRQTEVCVAQHKEAYPMSSTPPPPPTALPVAEMVMAAMTTATVTVAGAATTTTAMGASTATMVVAALTATSVEINNKHQSTKSAKISLPERALAKPEVESRALGPVGRDAQAHEQLAPLLELDHVYQSAAWHVDCLVGANSR